MWSSVHLIARSSDVCVVRTLTRRDDALFVAWLFKVERSGGGGKCRVDSLMLVFCAHAHPVGAMMLLRLAVLGLERSGGGGA